MSEYDLERSTLDLEEDLITRYILAVFYYSVNGPNWVIDSNPFWLSEAKHVCDWRSVVCSNDKVVGIEELFVIDMLGKIPLELNSLPSLTTIVVEQNLLGLEGPLTNLRKCCCDPWLP